MSESIVELAGNGLKIFESSKPDEKNQLLKLLVSNCILDNKKARISLYEPFNLLLKTPSCPMWSSIIATFRAENYEEYKELAYKIADFKQLLADRNRVL